MTLKKGDSILVIKGKDRGKVGKIVAVHENGRVLIEGINQYKKHIKPSKKYPQGGIIDTPMPIAASNAMIICPSCKYAARAKHKNDGKEKRRVCAKCNEVLDAVK
jgi:large subunit ribosomal protein L24